MSVKWFRVASEGATTDGRKISRETIEKMAKNYNREKYGARIWLEHMRGMLPDSVFRALGDVLALKAEVVDGKMRLFAQISPTADLVKMSQDRQKVFTSIELDPSFADTGEPYMVGLAVTDTPASLGTDVLSFNNGALLAHRKTRKEAEIAEAEESDLKFSDADLKQREEEQPGLLKSVQNLLARFTSQSDKRVTDVEAANAEKFAALAAANEQIAGAVQDMQALAAKFAAAMPEIEAVKKSLDDFKADVAKFREQVEGEPDPANQKRPAAAGGADRQRTDC